MGSTLKATFEILGASKGLREQAVSMKNRFFSGGPIENRSKKYFSGQISKKNKIFRKSEGARGVEISGFQIYRGARKPVFCREGVIFDRKFGILAKFWPRIDI